MQLRNVLQMTTGDGELMAMRSGDVGLDSLISVDIRSWFLKNLEVSLPVLKIMGNNTMAELADLVAAQVPPSLIPGLEHGDAPASNEDALVREDTSQPVPVVGTHDDDTSSSTDSSPDCTSTESSNGFTGASTPASREPKEVNGPLRKGLVQIDWNSEIALPEAAEFATNKIPAARPRVIVLTGVSGLLGRHLLIRLLQDPSVVEIVCIAVRRLDERLRSKELLEDGRIKYYEGDLRELRLGLSEEDAAHIFSGADAVIHNGADTSHLKFYPEIKAANTGSTKELIRLCMARKVPIHYLSSIGVALLGNYKSFPEISIAAHNPPVDGSYGYIAAKWASERMLEEFQKKRGVNVWIHRPSTIIREGADAENAAAQMDWMNALVAYMFKTKAVPVLKNLHGSLDFVYVQNATNSILTSVFENKPKSPSAGGSGTTYLHQVGDMVLPLENLKDFVVKATGFANIDEFPVEEWTARAVKAGLHRGIAALIDGMDDPGQPHYPRMLREGA